MRMIILIFMLLLFDLDVYSQKNGDKYNTIIKEAGKVTVNKGSVTITKADTVIVKIYTQNSNANTKLYLTELVQNKDSSGMWITSILISNPTDREYWDVDITLDFSSPVISGNWHFSEAKGASYLEPKNSSKMHLKALKVLAPYGLSAILKSKEKIKVEIYGIEGVN